MGQDIRPEPVTGPRRRNGHRGFRTRPFASASVILAGLAAWVAFRCYGHAPESAVDYG
ncbi:hypothetical protein C791_1162 [Amycolatopsis azurea DSM 43854]|uniref:Uncharacterized protein n=1 Tax=Amycolatopsis azurea DSM 43854 TaxID=1238180 RepID=M2PQ81_9PSEU|nr:hypothetical protein C791_1162 [Amycolatopsis azurea DSM 43854]